MAVLQSQDKALELFATRKVDGTSDEASSPTPMRQEEISQPDLTHETENYDHEHDENDFELNDNNVGDLDKYWTQETMDHDIPYSRCYASDSDDDGPDEEIDEDRFLRLRNTEHRPSFYEGCESMHGFSLLSTD